MSNRTKLPRRSRKIPVARKLPAATREKIEIAIEKLIDVLDAIEPDPDLEEDDHGGGDVVDEPHDAVEEGDSEPSLGATQTFNQESAWRQSTCDQFPDLEGEHDGREPDDDLELTGDENEPSLGSRQDVDQIGWSFGTGDDRERDDCDDEEEHDRELDPAENGVGDEDGAMEQWGACAPRCEGIGVTPRTLARQ